jgi:transposase-like protein
MGKRKKYTEEFKREAVQLMMTRGERTIADVATSLGVAENLLHSWKRTYPDTAEAVRKARGKTPEDELKRLRRENAQLLQQRTQALRARPSHACRARARQQGTDRGVIIARIRRAAAASGARRTGNGFFRILFIGFVKRSTISGSGVLARRMEAECVADLRGRSIGRTGAPSSRHSPLTAY